MLLAIEAIVCFTPLGSLPIGPLVATLAHIPVIITALTLGTGAGTLMGFMAGVFSFIVWSFFPPAASAAMAFVFTPVYPPGNFFSLAICFVPRILIGTFSGLVFEGCKKLFSKFDKMSVISYILAGIIGSLANTVGVLGGIYIFFGHEYAEVFGIEFSALLGAIMVVVGTNGVLELILGGLSALAIGKPLNKILAKTSR